MVDVRIGFVGAGTVNFGRPGVVPWDHASRLEKIDGVKVMAIADVDVDKVTAALTRRRAGRYADAYSECLVFSSVPQMLATVPLDALFVAVPPSNRGSLAEGRDLELAIVRRGVHCFVEKPLSVDEPETFQSYADAVLNACSTHKVVTSVGYMFRYHAAVRHMREIISARGGKVMAYNARYYVPYDQAQNKYWWDISKSGGSIIEQATHFCDLARFLVGEVDLHSVHTRCLREDDPTGAGRLSKLPPDLEDDVAPHLRHPRVTTSHWRFHDGALGSLMHVIALHGLKYDTEIDVIMDGLRLTLRDPYNPGCRLLIRDGSSGSDEEVAIDYGTDDPYATELSSFIEALRTGNASLIQSPYEDAIKTYELTWAIWRSANRS